MVGRCKNFEQCKFRHYQMAQILFKQNKIQNKIELINQEQHNNNKILVKMEQTLLMTQEQLMQTAQRAPEGISMAIRISYKNKKAINKLKNKLNKNQKDPFTNNEQKNAQEAEILKELLTNTQTDNKNKNALLIKEKIEKIKKEQSEKAQILKNKPKIIINKEQEENLVQNQQINQNQQHQDNNSLIQISDEQSDEEIDMTNYNFNYQKNSNNIINNTQTNYQLNNLNQSQNNFEQQQLKTPTQKININQFEYQTSQDLKQIDEINIHQTMLFMLVNPAYIAKDKQKDIQQNNQNEIKKLFGNEIQKDMKWSQNIKSLFQQWKQHRDGKDLSNIHSNSDEPSKQSPLNSTEIQEIVDESKNKLLYDWKKIYKSRAYRNDQLQNFISYQNPKLIFYYNEKVFNLATEFIDNEALQPEAHKSNNESIRLQEERQVSLTLNILYNKILLDKSLENYDLNELSEHFYNATEDPPKSHIHKMAIIINRYIKNLIQEILKNRIKNTENQKIIFTKEQYQSNQLIIIEALRNIIIQNNTLPYKMYCATTQGYTLVTLYEHHYLDWKNIENSMNKPQNN